MHLDTYNAEYDHNKQTLIWLVLHGKVLPDKIILEGQFEFLNRAICLEDSSHEYSCTCSLANIKEEQHYWNNVITNKNSSSEDLYWWESNDIS